MKYILTLYVLRNKRLNLDVNYQRVNYSKKRCLIEETVTVEALLPRNRRKKEDRIRVIQSFRERILSV
jgi:hypothetical protein